MVKDKVACFEDPEPMEVDEPIHYEGTPYIEMDGPIGYLEEIKWINYGKKSHMKFQLLKTNLMKLKRKKWI